MCSLTENKYRNIEFNCFSNTFKVVVGSRPQRLVAVCDTLEEAIRIRDSEDKAIRRATRETATFPRHHHYETRASNAA
jgi:hypothetical protein